MSHDQSPALEEDLQDILDLNDDHAVQKGSEINRLNQLGNQAIELKLISGHGFHQGEYELLRDGKFLLMTPMEALQYLESLIAETGA